MAEVAVITERRAFFTTRTLAEYLDVSERTVREWSEQGLIASYRLGRSRRFDPDDVDEFLRQRRERGTR